MKKRTKLLCVLSAVSCLTICAASVSMADTVTDVETGWVEGNDGWHYINTSGEKATESWKKSGDNWFYLDASGNMIYDSLIEVGDDLFYVNEDGVMVKNAWIMRANETEIENEAADNWYYFQANGKACKSNDKTILKTINGKKYSFNSEGKMLYGWVDDSAQLLLGDYDWENAVYFFQGDGELVTGWAEMQVTKLDDSGDGEVISDEWFYFNTKGEKVTNRTLTINGEKYEFADNGTMRTEWYNQASPSSIATQSAAGYQYHDYDSGMLIKGWFQAVPGKYINVSAHESEDVKWYYSSGAGNVVYSQIKTINNKKYAFNNKGEMLTGLQAIEVDPADPNKILRNHLINSSNDIAACTARLSDYEDFDFNSTDIYYFGEEESDDGAMRTGNINIQIDGDIYNCYFVKSGTGKGKGFGSDVSEYTNKEGTWFYNNSIYQYGIKVKADSAIKYQAFDAKGNKAKNLEDVTNGQYYLLNASGTIMKSKVNLENADERYYCTDRDGIITYSGMSKRTVN